MTSSHSALSPQMVLQSLIKAIDKIDLKEVNNILFNNSRFDINTKDPKTGRTAAHFACGASKAAIFQLLVDKYHADLTICDKEGFSVADLAVNPHPFYPFHEKRYTENKNRHIYFISELNLKLSANVEKRCQQRLEFADNTEQMLNFINRHPQFDQIGFLVVKPNAIRPEEDMHLSPILFIRKLNLFIQLDSQGWVYLLPDMAKSKLIYSPFLRQFSTRGCGFDAIFLLYEIMTKFPEFVTFCEGNSKKSDTIFKALSKNEIQALRVLYEKILNRAALTSEEKNHQKKERPLSDKEKGQYFELSNRRNIQHQLKSFKLLGLSHLKNVYCLMDWPIALCCYVERFDFMRRYRTINQFGHHKNYIYLKRLLECENKRTPNVTRKYLLANLLLNQSKDFDFAGTRFDVREDLLTHSRSSRYTTIYRLFATKLNRMENKEFNDKHPRKITVDAQKDTIADRIASFATGLSSTKTL